MLVMTGDDKKLLVIIKVPNISNNHIVDAIIDVVRDYLVVVEKINVQGIGAGVVEPDVGNEAVMLDLKWAGVVCKPQKIEWFEEMVPLVDEDVGHSTLDVNPLVCKHSYASDRCGIIGSKGGEIVKVSHSFAFHSKIAKVCCISSTINCTSSS